MWLWLCSTLVQAADVRAAFIAELASEEARLLAKRIEIQVLLDRDRALVAARQWAELARLTGDRALSELYTEKSRRDVDVAGLAVRYGEQHGTLLAAKASADAVNARLEAEAAELLAVEQIQVDTLQTQGERLAAERKRYETSAPAAASVQPETKPDSNR